MSDARIHEQIEQMLSELEDMGIESDALITIRNHFNENLSLNPGQYQRLKALYGKYAE